MGGTRDYPNFSFAASGVGGAAKPMVAQSKLWLNDLSGGVCSSTAPPRSITSTGTLVDERNFSNADALWDGNHLYAVSAGPNSTNSAHSARVSRYSYSTAIRSYALDPRFPVTVTKSGMKTIVLDKDTTGKLWVTYTKNNHVYVNRSLSDQQTGGTPFVLPVTGSAVSSEDDISAVVAVDSQNAVMWSNQLEDAMYFATHTDGEDDEVWQESRTAIQGLERADDHINLKALPAGDPSGRVFAAVKTSLDDLPNPDPNAPQILLLPSQAPQQMTSSGPGAAPLAQRRSNHEGEPGIRGGRKA